MTYADDSMMARWRQQDKQHQERHMGGTGLTLDAGPSAQQHRAQCCGEGVGRRTPLLAPPVHEPQTDLHCSFQICKTCQDKSCLKHMQLKHDVVTNIY